MLFILHRISCRHDRPFRFFPSSLNTTEEQISELTHSNHLLQDLHPWSTKFIILWSPCGQFIDLFHNLWSYSGSSGPWHQMLRHLKLDTYSCLQDELFAHRRLCQWVSFTSFIEKRALKIPMIHQEYCRSVDLLTSKGVHTVGQIYTYPLYVKPGGCIRNIISHSKNRITRFKFETEDQFVYNFCKPWTSTTVMNEYYNANKELRNLGKLG